MFLFHTLNSNFSIFLMMIFSLVSLTRETNESSVYCNIISMLFKRNHVFLVCIADGCKCYSPLGSFFYHAMQIQFTVGVAVGPRTRLKFSPDQCYK